MPKKSANGRIMFESDDMKSCFGEGIASQLNPIETRLDEIELMLGATEDGGALSPTSLAYTTTLIGTSSNANAIAVGPNGSTNPVLNVNAATASAATGIKITGAAAAAGVAMAVISSGTNENLTIDAKGSGTVTIAGTSTGDITLGDNVAVTGKVTGTSTDAAALTVGANGATNPVVKVNANTGSVATGLEITGAAAAAGVAIAAISSGTNEDMTVDAKGSGSVDIATTSTGGIKVGTDSTDIVAVKGIYMSPSNVSVSVPSMDDMDGGEVAVDVAGAFSMAPAVGDAVIAIPQEALPTDCSLCGAWVNATDTITVSFTTQNGAVTGASKNFKFVVIDVT